MYGYATVSYDQLMDQLKTHSAITIRFCSCIKDKITFKANLDKLTFV